MAQEGACPVEDDMRTAGAEIRKIRVQSSEAKGKSFRHKRRCVTGQRGALSVRLALEWQALVGAKQIPMRQASKWQVPECRGQKEAPLDETAPERQQQLLRGQEGTQLLRGQKETLAFTGRATR